MKSLCALKSCRSVMYVYLPRGITNRNKKLGQLIASNCSAQSAVQLQTYECEE